MTGSKVRPPNCGATIDTIDGIVTCHRSDGRKHKGSHFWDNIQNGLLVNRIVWDDQESGYGSVPSARLTNFLADCIRTPKGKATDG